MPGRHRSMGGEDASLPDGGEVGDRNMRPLRLASFFPQQLQREQAGMSLVHVEAIDALEAECTQHAHSADAQHYLLTQAVAGVATVKHRRQLPVPVAIFREIGIEKINRDEIAADPLYLVLPAAQRKLSTLDGERCSRRHLGEKLLHIPLDGRFRLPAVGVEALMKVPGTMKERYGDHGHLQIRCRTDRVTRKYTQTATVGGDA